MSEYQISSGNIFEDLGMVNSEEKLAKVKLASAIYDAIQRQEISKAKALEVLGIDSQEFEDLTNGRLKSFSWEKLFGFLVALGHNLEIVITQKPTTIAKTKASIEVVCS